MKKDAFYNKIEIWIILVTFVTMVCLTLFNVITRFCFSFTLSWTEQVTRILFIYLSYAGISYSGALGAHLRVTALVSLFGEAKGKFLLLVGDIVTVIASGYFVVIVSRMMMAIIRFKQHFSVLPWLPLWVMYLPAVLGLIGLVIRVIQRNYIMYKRGHFSSNRK